MFRKPILFITITILFIVGSLVAQQNQEISVLWEFGDSSADRRPLPIDQAEGKIFNVLEEIAKNDSWAGVVPVQDGRMLRILAESTDAKNVVEIGTYLGYSTIWFCLALRNTGGRIITHEISTEYIAEATENFKKAGVEELVTIVQGDAHETVKQLTEPIDILLIDADKPGYADYLEKLLPLVRPGGLILAHNTSDRAAELQDYFEAATTNPELDTIFINQQSAGFSITLKKLINN